MTFTLITLNKKVNSDSQSKPIYIRFIIVRMCPFLFFFFLIFLDLDHQLYVAITFAYGIDL